MLRLGGLELDIFVAESWIIGRNQYGEVTWYLSEKELRTLEFLQRNRDAIHRYREGRQ